MDLSESILSEAIHDIYSNIICRLGFPSLFFIPKILPPQNPQSLIYEINNNNINNFPKRGNKITKL